MRICVIGVLQSFHQRLKAKAVLIKKGTSLKDKASLFSSIKEQLIATIQQQHIEAKRLKEILSDLEINSNSIMINESIIGDIHSILGNADLKKTPHMDLFRQQQKKLLSYSSKFKEDIFPTSIAFASPFMPNLCLFTESYHRLVSWFYAVKESFMIIGAFSS